MQELKTIELELIRYNVFFLEFVGGPIFPNQETFVNFVTVI